MPLFEEFKKIPRYRQNLCITEKIDGTNAQVHIQVLENLSNFDIMKKNLYCIGTWFDEGLPHLMFAGSRNRWIAPENTPGLDKGCDNYGFAGWVKENFDDLKSLGEGSHYGEWWGGKIGRKYGRAEKTFSLFNAIRWNPNNPNKPDCCGVVDIIDTTDPVEAMMELKDNGSMILTDDGSRFQNPEGIIIYHPGSKSYFKQTFEYDKGKWSAV